VHVLGEDHDRIDAGRGKTIAELAGVEFLADARNVLGVVKVEVDLAPRARG